MAPTAPTHDYYSILQVPRTASLAEITKSYRRLALCLHPDRSSTLDATAAFQLLGAAYETLRDESKRRSYDRLYPSILKDSDSQAFHQPQPESQSQPQSQHKTKPQPETPPPPSAAKAKAEQDPTDPEDATIAATLKAKQERSAKWLKRERWLENTISALQRDIWKLQTVIREFEEKDKAKEAEEEAARRWSTRILSSSILSTLLGKEKPPVESEEAMEQKVKEELVWLRSWWRQERELEIMKKEWWEKRDMLWLESDDFMDADMSDDDTIKECLRAKLEPDKVARWRAEKVHRVERKREVEEGEKRFRLEVELRRSIVARQWSDANEAAERRMKLAAGDAEYTAYLAKTTREEMRMKRGNGSKKRPGEFWLNLPWSRRSGGRMDR